MSARRAITAAVVLLLLAGATVPVLAGGRVHVPSVATPWPGRLLVAHDEWALSDQGFRSAPTARQFALNVAGWFTGGRRGRFLVHSTAPGFTGSELARAMRAAGHTWTIDANVELTMAALQPYDAVFVGGSPVDDEVLIDYVRAGGSVFLQAGTGMGKAAEAEAWNGFLGAFGLRLDPAATMPRPPGVYPVTSTAPLFRGVSSLYEQFGHAVAKVNPADPYTRILMSDRGLGLYATYEATVVPVAVEICPNRLNAKSRDQISIAINGSAQMNVWSIDPGSVRVLGAAPRGWMLNYGALGWSGPLLGRTTLGSCGGGRSDRYLDLVLKFDTQDVVQAIQRALGNTVRDGDLVALTLTGRLRREWGGQSIVGEDLVAAHNKWSSR
jgi:hypothetical protein